MACYLVICSCHKLYDFECCNACPALVPRRQLLNYPYKPCRNPHISTSTSSLACHYFLKFYLQHLLHYTCIVYTVYPICACVKCVLPQRRHLVCNLYVLHIRLIQRLSFLKFFRSLTRTEAKLINMADVCVVSSCVL